MALSSSTAQWINENGFNQSNLDQPGKYQDTPVILASRRGLEAIVSELVDAGVNLNHRNMDGTNALWAAVVADNYGIATELLTKGIDIDNQNENGATALMYAASAGKKEWVKFLLENGADPHLKSLDDYSALELSSTVECLRLLKKAANS